MQEVLGCQAQGGTSHLGVHSPCYVLDTLRRREGDQIAMTLYIIATVVLLSGTALVLAYRQAQDEKPLTPEELEKQRQDNEQDLTQ